MLQHCNKFRHHIKVSGIIFEFTLPSIAYEISKVIGQNKLLGKAKKSRYELDSTNSKAISEMFILEGTGLG